jgi:hypothetical protein
LTREWDDVWVITGPAFLPKKEGNKWIVRYEVLGDAEPNVSVPTHFWKVILAQKGNNSVLASFLLPNERIDDATPLASFLVPLSRIEKATGLIFFENLRGKNVAGAPLQLPMLCTGSTYRASLARQIVTKLSEASQALAPYRLQSKRRTLVDDDSCEVSEWGGGGGVDGLHCKQQFPFDQRLIHAHCCMVCPPHQRLQHATPQFPPAVSLLSYACFIPVYKSFASALLPDHCARQRIAAFLALISRAATWREGQDARQRNCHGNGKRKVTAKETTEGGFADSNCGCETSGNNNWSRRTCLQS